MRYKGTNKVVPKNGIKLQVRLLHVENECTNGYRKRKMGLSCKAIGTDEIPVMTWKVHGEEGMNFLCDLTRKFRTSLEKAC